MSNGDLNWIANFIWAADLVQLRAFISATQPPLVAAFDLDNDGPARQKFLARLQGEIGKRGVIDVLRHGVQHGALDDPV
jgi:type I restriction enzyme R subunit